MTLESGRLSQVGRKVITASRSLKDLDSLVSNPTLMTVLLFYFSCIDILLWSSASKGKINNILKSKILIKYCILNEAEQSAFQRFGKGQSSSFSF